MRSRTLRLAAALLLAAATALGQEGDRQAPAAPEVARYEPRRIDTYGNLRHCDWTARLDNFAIELQNEPAARGYVVSYNVPGRHAYAPRQVRAARHYLSETRGLDPARLVLVEGGTREDLEEGQTELWVVPEGAEPPFAAPAADKYAADFSGRFDTFNTDPNVYEESYEMSAPDSAIARAELVAKLKQQPASVGHVVIRAPKGGAPGAWRHFARREEQLLAAQGAEATRLRTLDGGQAAGREVEIEFWVLPPGAAPPPAPEKKAEEAFSSAVRLHILDLGMGQGDEESQHWMLENLAEFLREHPRATALLVAREPTPSDEVSWAGQDDSGETAETAGAPEETSAETVEPEAPAESAEGDASDEAGQPDEAAGGPEEERELSMKELAEEWKAQLVGKYGVEAGRVAVAGGRTVRWPAGRINLWVIPEKGKWPDPSARDEDEAEREEFYGVAPEPAAPPAPR